MKEKESSTANLVYAPNADTFQIRRKKKVVPYLLFMSVGDNTVHFISELDNSRNTGLLLTLKS